MSLFDFLKPKRKNLATIAAKYSVSQPNYVMACPTVLPDKITIRHPDGVFQSESPSKPI
jgi:hypothetical protein